MTICREWLLIKQKGAIESAEPLKCRSWSCEVCAPERRRKLIAQAIGGNPNTFITLTVKPKLGESPETRARSLVYAWREIRRKASEKHKAIDWWHLVDWMEHDYWRHDPTRPRNRLGMQYPANGTIPFLAVFERTKRGEPHLHILCRSDWIPQQWLSDEMLRLTGAPIVDIRRTDDPVKAAGYCAKYVGKDPQIFGTCKRYWASQDYEIAPPQADDDEQQENREAYVFKGDLHDWMTNREREGWMVWQTPEGVHAWNPRHEPEPPKGSLVVGEPPPCAASL